MWSARQKYTQPGKRNLADLSIFIGLEGRRRRKAEIEKEKKEERGRRSSCRNRHGARRERGHLPKRRVVQRRKCCLGRLNDNEFQPRTKGSQPKNGSGAPSDRPSTRSVRHLPPVPCLPLLRPTDRPLPYTQRCKFMGKEVRKMSRFFVAPLRVFAPTI